MKKLKMFCFLAMTGFAFSAKAQVSMPSDLTQDCLDYIKAMPAELEYNFIEVPEDWDHPKTSPKIHVFYYAPGLHTLGETKTVPVAYYNGGPGYASHNIYEYFKANTPASAGVPFLYIDQRGTGCSSQFPQVNIDIDGAKRIALYGSRNIVRDSEAIRLKIFKDKRKWKVFGQSFGGYIVQRYLQIAPQAITKAYAHGASLMTDGIQWGMYRMLAQKRTAEEYKKQYPQDEDTLKRARALFPADACSGNQTLSMCGSGLLDYFGWSSLGFARGWPNLHKSIAAILDANGNLDMAYLQAQIGLTVSQNTSVNDLMVAIVPGREMPAGALNTWSCKLATKRLEAQGDNPMDWMFNECRMSLGATATYDAFMDQFIEKDYIKLADVKKSLKKYPKLEFYLYSGQMDSIVPVETFAEEANLLKGRIDYTNFEKTGHDWMFEDKIWTDLKR